MNVVMSFNPSSVGFTHPLTAELVTDAAPFIIDQLSSVVADHDDSETRKVDFRRVHARLSESTWSVVFRRNKVLITNNLHGENAQQFKALLNGNEPGSEANHMTYQVSKGWGGNFIKAKGYFSAPDRHKKKMLGGSRPSAGDHGDFYPGMLKFYSKRYEKWMYRRYVHPISAEIIGDFRRGVERSVLYGLEQAWYQLYDPEGNNESDEIVGSQDLEELSYTWKSKTQVNIENRAIANNNLDKQKRETKLKKTAQKFIDNQKGSKKQTPIQPPESEYLTDFDVWTGI